VSRRRPDPARSPEMEFALLRMVYLRRYDNDPAFCAALEELYASTVGSVPPLNPEYVDWAKALPIGPKDYVEPPEAFAPLPPDSDTYHRYPVAVDDFVVKWGLDRLEGLPHKAVPDGGDYVNAWCMIRQRWPESTPASEFSVSRGWGELVRELDTAVSIEFADSWDPTRERQWDAQQRLTKLAADSIRARLDSIAADAEVNGLLFRDTKPARERHLDWVFQLCRYRKTIVQIAREVQESQPEGSEARDWEDTVSMAVSRMARRLLVRTKGWYVTGRTSRPDR
jgi:hypothetical protein